MRDGTVPEEMKTVYWLALKNNEELDIFFCYGDGYHIKDKVTNGDRFWIVLYPGGRIKVISNNIIRWKRYWDC